ncbi:PAX-interacting protein 1-like isoform X2 [Adelges cooleyi]|uniref:PAX-interacting protein 1-like isoform X2 n=1 Tax=Adelges cooleyi TaxID=133065 RepID=UPI00218016B7|nr:PAX-interacting protein 1-like isoform X2 [Adelges cooleyi]
MFTCSICQEVFDGNNNSISTTTCGHVFHHGCLDTWLKRSKSCPHCRAPTVNDQLIRLFLQRDPNAHLIVWDRKFDIDLRTLRAQNKVLQDKETNNKCTITKLELEIGTIKSKLHQENQLKGQLEQLQVNYHILEDHKNNLELQLQLEKAKCVSLDNSIYELHSVNTVVIEKLRRELADSRAKSAYFKKRCQELRDENFLYVQCSSKSFQNVDKANTEESNISSQVDHIKPEYYGHDSNLKLSSKNCLLGCVFLIVDDYHQWEDICSDVSMSKLSIIEHGGTIVQDYSSRITHIICTTQKHSIVDQGIKDHKRCVTRFWLTDVIAKETMLPPWFAHHFPTPFDNRENLPCQHLKIAIAEFEVNEYYRVKAMVELTGAQVVNEVTSRTDIIVSKRNHGETLDIAYALNRPVVNVEWLNDILFGAQYCISHPDSPKYQQFKLIDTFNVNYDMIPHLMEAWKTPVLYLKNQQVCDLTSPTKNLKRKRQNLSIDNCNPELIDLTDNDETSSNDIVITYISNAFKPCVMLNGFSKLKQRELEQIVLQLNGTIAKQCNEATHLIMEEPKLTLKFLCCLSTVNQILNPTWLYHSLDELKFTGGMVEKEIRSLHSVQQLEPNKYVIISCSEDLYLVNDFLKIGYAIHCTEFITNSIMTQIVQMDNNVIYSAALE